MEGGFRLAAGTLGDLYGRKRILTVTTWLFVIATFGCALAPTAPLLIIARGFQGLGGAALLSLPVAILVQMLPDVKDNENAIKMFSTVAGLGAVAGPVLGGVLVHWFGWPAVFYLSVVMGLIVLATFPSVNLMPSNIAFFIANQYSSQLEKTIGQRAIVALSFGISVIGIAWISVLGTDAKPWAVSAGLFIAGIGWGFIFTPAASMGMAAVTAADEGFASGAIALSRSLFGVFGIAVLGSLLAAGMSRGIMNGLTAMGAPAHVVHHVAKAVHHGGAFSLAQNPPSGITAPALAPPKPKLAELRTS